MSSKKTRSVTIQLENPGCRRKLAQMASRLFHDVEAVRAARTTLQLECPLRGVDAEHAYCPVDFFLDIALLAVQNRG
jgi:hypothetical protein